MEVDPSMQKVVVLGAIGIMFCLILLKFALWLRTRVHFSRKSGPWGKNFLLGLSFSAFFAGFSVLSWSKSAIHEIEALVIILVGAVLLSGAVIVEAINRLAGEIGASKSNMQNRSDSLD